MYEVPLLLQKGNLFQWSIILATWPLLGPIFSMIIWNIVLCLVLKFVGVSTILGFGATLLTDLSVLFSHTLLLLVFSFKFWMLVSLLGD